VRLLTTTELVLVGCRCWWLWMRVDAMRTHQAIDKTSDKMLDTGIIGGKEEEEEEKGRK